MTSFNRSTSRRLQKLPQIPSVWEGDRRPLSSPHTPFTDPDAKGDCILWVDASEGIVRSMDMVDPALGPEAIVRTLMQAIEHPQSPAKPGRPQRIVVRDREIQFYLRGVLQDLDIAIDYVPELPIIDELFRSFAEVIDSQIPDLPPKYAQLLHDKALEVWQSAPWRFLEEQQILSIEINQWDVEKLYASVMGMLGIEYGILFYRSEDSLKRFRAAVLADEDELQQDLEEAFLKQDCLFLTFDSLHENEDDDLGNLAQMPLSEIEPTFGNIHPLEGLRSVLYEEEALLTFVAVESLLRFLHDHHRQLYDEDFLTLSQRYRISLPETDKRRKSLTVTVSTMPELTAELEEMAGFDLDDEDDEDEDDSIFEALRDDLIPEDAFMSLGVLPWETLNYLRQAPNYQAAGEFELKGDGLPVIVIQTSRPKAKGIIENIQAAGGLNAICFHTVTDPVDDDLYDLGLLQTHNNELFLFGQFLDDDPVHIEAKKKWHQRCKNTKGHCGLIIAKGLTGTARGNPQLRDMMALLEANVLSSEELNLETLD
ncbi:hypothetical protein VB638_22590 [Dolichospermum sp. UHCC 0684]|jgi:hypothetical protein|uniref:Uncharacterized protein n=1 Tax=Dolichospermum flos-aquae CCAP 1403/13F TaxID=315271 RepID=A0A6H2C248_DOLFA|nr:MULTISPECIES: hypothetical protein [Nostocales]AFW94692.1 hypothetical protein ANA_C11937 [Anabaena sp. 90]MEA5532322.1 hypothetical protein [Dolichospermum sp. UHCC 0684]MTJ16476.1 hypothetical protein [Dolichospermum sp. UHCC 0299]MTJ34976.1 hypothetical protein [Dolichospermum sp. UHCC 0260]MTJ38263.1 hypothetical protein [Dolichospermum sp. UHCC 0406]